MPPASAEWWAYVDEVEHLLPGPVKWITILYHPYYAAKFGIVVGGEDIEVESVLDEDDTPTSVLERIIGILNQIEDL